MAAGEHQHASHRGQYLRTWFWLIVLMGLKVAVVSVPMPDVPAAVALVILMAMNIYLIAAYFMHLRFERVSFIYVTLSPVILAVVLFFALYPDFAAGFGR